MMMENNFILTLVISIVIFLVVVYTIQLSKIIYRRKKSIDATIQENTTIKNKEVYNTMKISPQSYFTVNGLKYGFMHAYLYTNDDNNKSNDITVYTDVINTTDKPLRLFYGAFVLHGIGTNGVSVEYEPILYNPKDIDGIIVEPNDKLLFELKYKVSKLKWDDYIMEYVQPDANKDKQPWAIFCNINTVIIEKDESEAF